MSDRWYMSAFLRGTPAESVDRETGVIHGAAIVTAGEAKGHGVQLDDEFVNEVVRLGNAKQQGVKVRFGHPTMSSTALGTFLGRAKHFRYDRGVARADIYLSNTAHEAPAGNGQDLYGYVLSLAAEDADMFGTSIVFTPGETYRRDEEGEKIPWIEQDGDQPFVEIRELHAADIVDEPAANPDGLFSSLNQTTLAGQVAEFLDTHPNVWELIEKNPDAMKTFLARYEEHKSKSTTRMEAVIMPDETELIALDETVTADVETVDETAELADPQTATDAETFDVGDDDEAAPNAVDTENADKPDDRATFRRVFDEFGADIACEVYLSGGTLEDAAAMAKERELDRLRKENETLKAQVQTGGDEPVTFDNGERGKSFRVSEADAAARGLTPARASVVDKLKAELRKQ